MFYHLNINSVRRPSVLTNFSRKRLGRVLTALCLPFIAGSLLTGCALPLPIQVASWALDGVFYVATNKSILDHGISGVSGQDCAMYRIVTEGAACRDVTPVSVVNTESSESVVYPE